MEVACLRHPGASTIGSQLLDGDCSNGWQILATQLRTPMQERENCLDDEVPLQNNTASSHSKHTKDCFKWRTNEIPTHAHIQKLLTTRERWCSLLLTLLNCSKLHLIKKTVVTIYQWVWQTSSYWNFLLLTITSSIPPLSPYFFSCWV